MKLTIITINRNNDTGLEQTILSVLSQTDMSFQYIIIDGASTDHSIEIIHKYDRLFGNRLKWISESDSGIYNAMNKGIRMAEGDYVQFLNSGDCLADKNVVSCMIEALENAHFPSILYGNMIKVWPDGRLLRDKCFAGNEITMLGFYQGTLNHSPAYIRKDLYDKYGLYDETLKIVSDWKWYLQAIILGKEKPVYVDLDVTRFDMTGISETQKDLDKTERRIVLKELVPPTILSDYERWTTAVDQMRRIKRHPWAFRIVWIVERFLFKLEKHRINRKKEISYPG